MSFSKMPGKRGPRWTPFRGAFDGALRREKTTNPAPSRSISPDEVKRFVQLPLSMEANTLLAEVDRLLEDGVEADAIYIELLAPAARRLGELWEDDQCDFVEVTMGLWRLQEVLHEISARAAPCPKLLSPDAKRAVFLPMPGDQHFLGSQMLEDVFTRAGWDAIAMTKPLRKEVLDLISRESFDVVGLTLSRDCPSSGLKNIIKAMRSVSRNEHISILVGGRMIHQNPAVVTEVGADGTGADARAALREAERLVQSAKVRTQTLR